MLLDVFLQLGADKNIKVSVFDDLEQIISSGCTDARILFYDVTVDNSDKASVLTEIKRKIPGIKIIPVCDALGKDRLTWALKRGAINFLEKPCSLKEIESLINSLETDI